jgi:hypothetical protein
VHVDARYRTTVVAALLWVTTAACGGPPAPASPPTSDPPAATSTPPSGGAPSGAPSTSPGAAAFDHVALWPFADAAQARAWQDAYRAGGHQPWHLDPEATALGFASGYLGFAEIDRATTVTTVGDEAWIGVGFALPNGADTTAAEVHLARYGTGEDAPWEVVGTRDSTLVLDTPRYGSTLGSPLVVGGSITGVDESLHVRVLGPGGPAGESCCLPAGGENTRWSLTVPVTGTPTGALTVVVSTGGHVAEVERFAITGVRAG